MTELRAHLRGAHRHLVTTPHIKLVISALIFLFEGGK